MVAGGEGARAEEFNHIAAQSVNILLYIPFKYSLKNGFLQCPGVVLNLLSQNAYFY